jgi:diguanylate cyclase (GGDEF)-like protein
MTSSSTPLRAGSRAIWAPALVVPRRILRKCATPAPSNVEQSDMQEKSLTTAKRSPAASDIMVAASRTRVGQPLSGADRRTSTTLGALFVATATLMAVVGPRHEASSWPVAMLLIAGYAVASRVEFEIGPGAAIPTQLLFVPMLFVLPASAVPLGVACGYLLGACPEYAAGRIHIHRALVLMSSSWYSIGPALVFAVAGVRAPKWSDWPVYVIALASQFTLDLSSSSAREWFSFRTPVNSLLPLLAWVYAVDTLLAPLGLLAAFAGTNMEFGFVLTLPFIGLLALLARDRRVRIDEALDYSRAYREASLEARKDPLTGLGNRLAWEEASALADAGRAASSAFVSVIVLDLDGLKLANDTRGHQFGDDMLRAIGALVRAHVRDGDLVARIGGDEFAVLMLDTDEEACAQTVVRLAGAIQQHPGVDGFALSAAIGHATCPPAHNVPDAMRVADSVMYSSKSYADRSAALADPPPPDREGLATIVRGCR